METLFLNLVGYHAICAQLMAGYLMEAFHLSIQVNKLDINYKLN